MSAMGKLGSYFTKGVFTVVGQFHPFGGAIDIIVVEQPDGSFKSSPWYVRFGKFQGVLTVEENVVGINVNGVNASFHMYLDHRGEAYFLREAEGEEAESLSSVSSSTDETSVKSLRSPRQMKSKSCKLSTVTVQDEGNRVKKMERSTSRRSKLIGFVFGRRSKSEGSNLQELNRCSTAPPFTTPLESAEIAADLLEVKWSTNLATSGFRKRNGQKLDASTPLCSNLQADISKEGDSETFDEQRENKELQQTSKERDLHEANRTNEGTEKKFPLSEPALMSCKIEQENMINFEVLLENMICDVKPQQEAACCVSGHDLASLESDNGPPFCDDRCGIKVVEASFIRKPDNSENQQTEISEHCLKNSADENEKETNQEINEAMLESTRKLTRLITPTSQQLKSLDLREGKNTVSYTFFNPMTGKQQIDARIFLWKWNARIVISDVDGTITKSDVLGQFMPLLGADWSQTGVANLFSAIKENGYQLMFLSARAISQAYLTRKFLFNINQNGQRLPDGPVVISPDGLFPSLVREVIRRVPHEFKIACLQDIKELFPSDCNPFYAGFGNRDTDEISYLKVGIPKGKIFIINPKGQIVVNRCVNTKSYHSLHDLVHGMFPSMLSSEQEDYNAWNFWKLPLPFLEN